MKQNIRSDEIQDIIERMPAKFGLILTSFITFLIVVVLTLGFTVNYPDVISGTIVIRKGTLPVRIVNKTYGNIRISDSITSKINVKKGEYLAFLDNQANVDDMQKLKKSLAVFLGTRDYKILYSRLQTTKANYGEISAKVSALKSMIEKLSLYKSQNIYRQQTTGIKQLIADQQNLVEELEAQVNVRNQNLKLSRSMFYRDSLLAEKELISKVDFEKSKQAYISGLESLHILNKERVTARQRLKDFQGQILQDEVQGTDKGQDYQLQFDNYYNDLSESILDWEQKYVLKAPISGRLEILRLLEDNQFIKSGEELFAIVPTSENDYNGYVEIPSSGAGKVKLHQKVIVKLDDYPYREFGSVEGRVVSISSILKSSLNEKSQEVGTYMVKVSLPKKMSTNFDMELQLKPGTKGVAEIITERRKLFERLFSGIKHSLKD